VPRITSRDEFNGFTNKVTRLGLEAVIAEAEATLGAFELQIEESRHANGTRGIRQLIDAAFEGIGGWRKLTSGGIDWTKENARGATVGVEVQVSGRSDMLAVDVMHLKEDLERGVIDVGVIIVPDDALSRYLTDRTPNRATALKHVRHRAQDLPIQVVAFGHDGVGMALAKMRTNLGRSSG
jgi:Restriction endonuclease BamHI